VFALSGTALAQAGTASRCVFPFYWQDRDNVAISPAAPDTSQLVEIKVRSDDAIGRAITARVYGTNIDVILDALAGDQPHGCDVVEVGPLAPGTYTINYIVLYTPGAPPTPRATKQFTVADRAPQPNYQGLWWAAPSGAEPGWGINFAHEGDTIVATWFTYDDSGTARWMVMTAPLVASKTYSGTLYATHSAWPVGYYLSPGSVTATPVGVGTLTFSSEDNATFTYELAEGTAPVPPQTKAITRQVFGPVPTCIFGALADLRLATNFTGLWWSRPAASEPGWGINFSHQGDVIFASWFTYDRLGAPMWFVMTAPSDGQGVFEGSLYRTTGPGYFETSFDPSKVVATPVGSAYVAFYDGNTATFSFSMRLPELGPVTENIPITRETFAAPGTVCQ